MIDSSVFTNDDLLCKPLDSYSEIMDFVENPPAWRSLCEDMTPHSKYKIRNCEISHEFNDITIENPATFCHFDTDTDSDSFQRHLGKNLPKTLVCHDMANGYHDDSFIDGSGAHDAYLFYNWAGIDIFCYFSHHLITIPPLGWINVGHAHGVKVIGTIITEWADGVHFWDSVLGSDEQMQTLVSALVAIAKTLKFDGYLLNVENKVTLPERLVEFVCRLHTTLHQELPEPVLIWYDSVTIDGNLHWQNGLNDKNKAFFDACDGFFTNYSWKETDVLGSAAAAQGRLTDLYIGMDVWGRNFFGGGMFNIQEAVRVAHAVGCSLAIFAPAWTHEAMNIPNDPKEPGYIEMAAGLTKYERFLLRDRALWGSVWPYLNTGLPCALPFKTSFCRGQGTKRRMYGEVISPEPWFNLREMQYQPNAAHGPHGYLLSTRLSFLKSHPYYKDHRGIMKIRESMQKIKSDSNTLESYDSAMDIISAENLSSKSLNTKDKALASAAEESPKEPVVRVNTGVEEEQYVKRDPAIESVPKKGALKKRQHKEPVLASHAVTEGLAREISEREAHVKEDHTEEAISRDNSNSSSRSLKRKMRDALLCCLKRRNEAEAGPSLGKSASVYESSGKSMVTVDVKIDLQKADEEHKARYELVAVADELECLELFHEDSFIGGACLKINPSDAAAPGHRTIRLLLCDFHCEDYLVVCVVTKTLVGSESQTLNVQLLVKDSNEKDVKVTLVGGAGGGAGGAGAQRPLAAAPLHSLRAYLLTHERGFYVPADNATGWAVRYYQVRLADMRVTAVACRAAQREGPILLGHIALCQRRDVS